LSVFWTSTTELVCDVSRRVVRYHLGQFWRGVFWLLLVTASTTTCLALGSAYRLAGVRASGAAARRVHASARAAALELARMAIHSADGLIHRSLRAETVEPEAPSRSERLQALAAVALRITLETRTGLAIVLFAPPVCLLAIFILMLVMP
jgi:hypothetical protein